VIQSFRHRGLALFFTTGSVRKIRPEHAKRLRLILGPLHTATTVQDVNFPGSGLHALHGDLRGFWAVNVSGNWRLVFRFFDGHVWEVDYRDYH
jgi:proteic killer suppression protein